MAKAQTDIRTTSYDELAARPLGYQGSIDSVIAQMRGEGGWQSHGVRPTGRAELLHYLGVDKIPSAGPSVEMDKDVWYGEDGAMDGEVTSEYPSAHNKAPDAEPGFYTLAYALKHFPQCFANNTEGKS